MGNHRGIQFSVTWGTFNVNDFRAFTRMVTCTFRVWVTVVKNWYKFGRMIAAWVAIWRSRRKCGSDSAYCIRFAYWRSYWRGIRSNVMTNLEPLTVFLVWVRDRISWATPTRGKTTLIDVISNVSRHALTSTRSFIRTTTLWSRVVITLVISISTTPTVMADRLCTITTYFTSSTRCESENAIKTWNRWDKPLQTSNVYSGSRFSLSCRRLVRCQFNSWFESRFARLWIFWSWSCKPEFRIIWEFWCRSNGSRMLLRREWLMIRR